MATAEDIKIKLSAKPTVSKVGKNDTVVLVTENGDVRRVRRENLCPAFWTGSYEDYAAISDPDEDTLYFFLDEDEGDGDVLLLTTTLVSFTVSGTHRFEAASLSLAADGHGTPAAEELSWAVHAHQSADGGAAALTEAGSVIVTLSNDSMEVLL